MKSSIFTILLVGVLFACSSKNEESNSKEQNNPEVEAEQQEESKAGKQDGIQNDGAYREFYDNGSVKIEGFLDQKGEKNGLWKGYSPDGRIQSEIFYLNGMKNGHGVVFFPNGKPRYIGEYKNDKKVGKWRFYDEKGEVIKEEEFK